MSAPDPGGRPGQQRSPSSASQGSSTVPSTVPHRQSPPRGGGGRSSPPQTPYPVSGTHTNATKKSVRFAEKSEMKFYQPDPRPEPHQRSRGAARGKLFSTPKSRPDRSSTQLGSSRTSFFSPEDKEMNRWTMGVFSGEQSQSSSGLEQEQDRKRNGPTFSRKLDEFNFQTASSTSDDFTPKSVSTESLEKVRRMLKKRKLPVEHRQSTVDTRKVGSLKATNSFFSSSVSPILGAQTGGNLLQSFSTIPKRARPGQAEETDPNTSKQGIPSASSASLYDLDKAPSTHPDVSLKSSSKATGDSAAGVDGATDKESASVFKVPTFPAPSRHKSYFNTGETPKSPSKPAATKSSSEKTVSTIPKKSRQPQTTAGAGAKGPQPPSSSKSIDSIFDLLLPNRKKPVDPVARNQRIDSIFEKVLSSQKKPEEKEELSTLPSTVRGPKSQLPLNLLSGDVVRVRVRRGPNKTKDKVEDGSQPGPGTATVSTIPPPPPPPTKRKDPPASTAVSSVFTTKRRTPATTKTATEKQEVARKSQEAERLSGDLGDGADVHSGISSIRPSRETKQPPNGFVGSEGSESNIPDRAKVVPGDGESLYTTARLSRLTTGKLMSFSLRLRNLGDPATTATPATGKKTTQRHEILTPRPQARTKTPDTRARSATATATTLNMTLDPPDPRSFAAVFEGTGSAAGEVGVASFSLSSPSLIVCQFSDSPTYPMTVSKLLSINPAQILVPDITGSGGKLYEDIEAKIKGSKVVKVQRKFFNETKGLAVIRKLVVPEFSTVEMQFINKYYCLAAAAALIKYIEVTESFFIVEKTLKVEYQVAEKSTIIDPVTADHLELLSPRGEKKSKVTLFGLLNQCSSEAGLRLLRSNLFQPPREVDLINDRLELLEELVSDVNKYSSLRSIIARMPELDSILSLCIKRPEIDCTLTQLETLINKIVALRQVLQLLPSLHEILQRFTSKICREAVEMFKKNVNSSCLLLEMMLLVLATDVAPRLALKDNKFEKLSVIREDVNGLLDMARSTCREYVEKLEHEISVLRQERFYNC